MHSEVRLSRGRCDGYESSFQSRDRDMMHGDTERHAGEIRGSRTGGDGRNAVNRHLTAIVEREGDGYVALCPQVDVASQGENVAEARDNLAEALALLFQTAPAEEVDRHLRGEVYVTQIEVAVG